MHDLEKTDIQEVPISKKDEYQKNIKPSEPTEKKINLEVVTNALNAMETTTRKISEAFTHKCNGYDTKINNINSNFNLLKSEMDVLEQSINCITKQIQILKNSEKEYILQKDAIIIEKHLSSLEHTLNEYQKRIEMVENTKSTPGFLSRITPSPLTLAVVVTLYIMRKKIQEQLHTLLNKCKTFFFTRKKNSFKLTATQTKKGIV